MQHPARTLTGLAIAFTAGVTATSILRAWWTLFIRWLFARGG